MPSGLGWALPEILPCGDYDDDDRGQYLDPSVGLFLQIAMAVALADSPHLPESVRTDQNGDTYPWFVDGGFDESPLDDAEVRSTFQEWITEGAARDLITDLIPALSEMYDAGITRGKAS